jgi:hypothetical protein
MIRLAGILREQTFSPGHHAENDRLVLELTADVLRGKGCAVDLFREEDLRAAEIDAPVVFSMCQGPSGCAELAALEGQGALIINSPRAVQKCHRVNLARVLGPHCASVAPMTVVSTRSALFPLEPGRAYWIKRGDVHATQPGDVVRVETNEQYVSVLGDLASRGVEEAVVQPHIDGTVVKFYGVVGTSFFRFYSERDHDFSPPAFHSARPAIEQLVQRVGLTVYGGDAVLTPDGLIAVIDVNDWPSFAYFRAEAAGVIGAHILELATLHMFHDRRVRADLRAIR